jgi:hypothetical protein
MEEKGCCTQKDMFIHPKQNIFIQKNKKTKEQKSYEMSKGKQMGTIRRHGRQFFKAKKYIPQPEKKSNISLKMNN